MTPTLTDQLRDAAMQYPELGPLLVEAAQRIDAQARELRRTAATRRPPLPSALTVTDDLIDRLADDIDRITTRENP